MCRVSNFLRTSRQGNQSTQNAPKHRQLQELIGRHAHWNDPCDKYTENFIGKTIAYIASSPVVTPDSPSIAPLLSHTRNKAELVRAEPTRKNHIEVQLEMLESSNTRCTLGPSIRNDERLKTKCKISLWERADIKATEYRPFLILKRLATKCRCRID